MSYSASNMIITETTRRIVADAIRRTGISQKELAAALGVNPGWMTKFFNGKLQTLEEGKIKVMQDVLQITLRRIVDPRATVPGAAIDIGRAMEKHPELVGIVNGLLALVETQEPVTSGLPYFTPKELEKIGAEVTRIAYAWDEAADPHYAKVGVETVKALAKFAAAHAKKAQPQQQQPVPMIRPVPGRPGSGPNAKNAG